MSSVSGQSAITLCVDIGGTKIKLVRCDAQALVIGDPHIVDTPHPSDPTSVMDVVGAAASNIGDFDRVSVGFPSVVRRGTAHGAVNLTGDWSICPIVEMLEQRLHRPVRAANDADVQGLGAIRGDGVELVLTLGTGIGSALFLNGTIVPNLELGHLPYVDEKSFEQCLGDPALREIGVDTWLSRLLPALRIFDRCFNYDVLYLGGGNARHLIDLDGLADNIVLIRNDAGLTGGVALWEPIPENREVPRLVR